MGWTHIQPLFGRSVDPPIPRTSARKNQRMLAVIIDHGEFQITIKRRKRGRLPHDESLTRLSGCALI